MKRSHFGSALKFMGVGEFKLQNADDYAMLRKIWREQLCEARRTRNDEVAKMLSECNEAIKKQWKKTCPDCGHLKNENAARCPACRFKSPAPPPTQDYQVGEGILIPIKTTSFRKAMMQLDKVGAFLSAPKTRMAAHHAAKDIGIKIITRPSEKPGWIDIWRSDGLSMAEVNDIIRGRSLPHQGSRDAPQAHHGTTNAQNER